MMNRFFQDRSDAGSTKKTQLAWRPWQGLRWFQRWMQRWGISLTLSLLFLGAAGLPSLAHRSLTSVHYEAAPNVLRPAYADHKTLGAVSYKDSMTHEIGQAAPTGETLEQQGRQHYEEERFEEAIALWQHALLSFQTTGSLPQQITVLSNLSLAYQALGHWDEADTKIQQAIALLHASVDQTSLEAQVLDVQGRLHLARGQAELALATWRQAADLYEASEELRLIQNRINQAQALQALGLYRQARSSLMEVNQGLAEQPDSSLKALGLRSLGNVLRVLGELEASQQQLQQSLQVAKAIANPQAIGEAFFSLGHTARAQGDWQMALNYYQQAALTATSPVTQVSAQLRQFTLLLEGDQVEAAPALIPALLAQVESLPPTRTAIFARIELARRLLALPHGSLLSSPIPTLLVTAVEQAQHLQDLRAESYARGTLAQVYELNGQWQEAATLNQQAMLMAQTIHAPEIAYQWHWQLGRLLRDQGNVDGAIAAYEEAVDILQALRRDLVAVDSEVQYSFRDDVEPVYRQFIDLLLAPPESGAISQDTLRKARDTLEALQLAELDNFLREACLAPRKDLDRVIDQDDATAAVIYGIMMGDRLEVILKLPQQALKRYTTWIAQADAETILADLRSNLGQPEVGRIPQIQTLSQQVYRWLVESAEPALAEHHIKTLVFVLDGVLRSVPMAVLYDGQHYLIEKYAIALSSGLQLVDPQPLEYQTVEVLAGGLSEERFFPPDHFFSALQYVEQELDQIQTELPSQLLLNQQFTTQTLQQQINSHPYPIVHLATHGVFNHNPEETFLVVWDQLIKVNDLDDFLRIRDQSQFEPLELLILSACQTAEGDRRAVLGLAGVAVRAGARSTLASLWNLDDESTTRLMDSFYEALVTREQPRAEALRQAQLKLLQESPSPYFWAPFVLIGSWL